MELNYITFIQEILASFLDFEFIQKKGVPEANQPDNFYKGRKKRQLAINLLEKYSNLYSKRSKLAMQFSSSKTLK